MFHLAIHVKMHARPVKKHEVVERALRVDTLHGVLRGEIDCWRLYSSDLLRGSSRFAGAASEAALETSGLGQGYESSARIRNTRG